MVSLTVYSVVIFSHRYLDSDRIHFKTFVFLAVYWSIWTSSYNTDIKVQQLFFNGASTMLNNVFNPWPVAACHSGVWSGMWFSPTLMPLHSHILYFSLCTMKECCITFSSYNALSLSQHFETQNSPICMPLYATSISIQVLPSTCTMMEYCIYSYCKFTFQLLRFSRLGSHIPQLHNLVCTFAFSNTAVHIFIVT